MVSKKSKNASAKQGIEQESRSSSTVRFGALTRKWDNTGTAEPISLKLFNASPTKVVVLSACDPRRRG